MNQPPARPFAVAPIPIVGQLAMTIYRLATSSGTVSHIGFPISWFPSANRDPSVEPPIHQDFLKWTLSPFDVLFRLSASALNLLLHPPLFRCLLPCWSYVALNAFVRPSCQPSSDDIRLNQEVRTAHAVCQPQTYLQSHKRHCGKPQVAVRAVPVGHWDGAAEAV